MVRHFTQQFSRRMKKVMETIPSPTMDALCRYHWPGNIRELQNVIERAVIVSAEPAPGGYRGGLKISNRHHLRAQDAASHFTTTRANHNIFVGKLHQHILPN